jgi:putative transcriptional regulator
VLQDVVEGHGPDHLLLALGYAGWSSGQLENEIMQNGWLLLPAEASILFDPDPESLWRRTLQKFGVDPDHLSSEAGHA